MNKRRDNAEAKRALSWIAEQTKWARPCVVCGRLTTGYALHILDRDKMSPEDLKRYDMESCGRDYRVFLYRLCNECQEKHKHNLDELEDFMAQKLRYGAVRPIDQSQIPDKH